MTCQLIIFSASGLDKVCGQTAAMIITVTYQSSYDFDGTKEEKFTVCQDCLERLEARKDFKIKLVSRP